MKLTKDEREMLSGKQGSIKAKAIDYLIQFGEAFSATRLIDIDYCHYPAEMAIYEGAIEDLVEFAKNSPSVVVPTTTSTLCCDLDCPSKTGIPDVLAKKQLLVREAYQKLGILETYTCTPELNGFVPTYGSNICSVESSAIIYFNSALGARTNRGGLFTRYSAITGKYPMMGYLLPENRIGTHSISLSMDPGFLSDYRMWTIFGFLIGEKVGSQVPVIHGINHIKLENLIGFGAGMATSGSVTLYHIEGVTPDSLVMGDCFDGKKPVETYVFDPKDFEDVIQRYTTIKQESDIDFVTLGCPHYSLEQIRYVAEKLENRKISTNLRFWICTSRMIRKLAEFSGYVHIIEKAGARVVADTCPVESHMRKSTCLEHGLPVPNVSGMVTDSVKMVRYVSDLIGCKVALVTTDQAIEIALKGRGIH
jgi:predicted aconitase